MSKSLGLQKSTRPEGSLLRFFKKKRRSSAKVFGTIFRHIHPFRKEVIENAIAAASEDPVLRLGTRKN